MVPLLLALVACDAAPDFWSEVDPAVTAVYPGDYEGAAHIVLVASAGGVPVARRVCDAPLSLRVAGNTITSELTCDIRGYGEEDAAFVGTGDPLPYLSGAVEVDGASIPWEGAFLSADALFGEIAGEVQENGLALRWEGWFEAERLPGTGYGG